jgi:hypothetical protein
MHFSNHLPLNQDLISIAAKQFMDENCSTLPAKFFENWGVEYVFSSVFLIQAIFQVVITTNISLQAFSPVYLERGLGASIGAHMMYNLNCIQNKISIPIRLLVRLYMKFIIIYSKKKADAADVATDSSFKKDANEEGSSK